MMIVMSSSVPKGGDDKKAFLANLKRVKRQMESKRLEQMKNIRDSAKKIAQEEVEYVKSLLPKELFDLDEE